MKGLLGKIRIILSLMIVGGIDLIFSSETLKTPKLISVTHNPKTGQTIIKWQDIESNRPVFYNIYRYNEPINNENVFFSSLIGEKIPSGIEEYIYTVNKSGVFYYAITVTTESGKEIKIFTPENTSGPIEEIDRTPPNPVNIEISFKNRCPIISWKTPSIKNPEDILYYNVYRWSKTSKIPRLRKRIPLDFYSEKIIYTDVPISKEGIFYYAITAVDTSGNESPFSNTVLAGPFPDLTISQENTVARNKDLKLSKMYPVVGQSVKFEVMVHNNGCTLASNVELIISGRPKNNKGKEEILFQGILKRIPESGSSTINFEWIPQNTGIYQIKIIIDPKRKILELDKNNNQTSIEIAVASKDIYFLWYGDPVELIYVNIPHAGKCNINEWKRRGALPCKVVGIETHSLTEYCKIIEEGYSGIIIDEIGGMDEKTRRIVSILPEIKKTYPNFFIGVWQIGYKPEKEIVELVKNGIIDLLILEIYLYVGSSLEPIEKAIDEMRKLGIISKVIIGLGTDACYGKWHTPEEHASFIESQIRLIRMKAPEMPGVGFFTSNTLQGVKEKIDRICYEYFLINKF